MHRQLKRKALRRFDVELIPYGADEDWTFRPVGAVLLFWQSPPHELRHALEALRIYAPRGLDSVEWFSPTRVCVIRDASGFPMCRLTERKKSCLSSNMTRTRP